MAKDLKPREVETKGYEFRRQLVEFSEELFNISKTYQCDRCKEVCLKQGGGWTVLGALWLLEGSPHEGANMYAFGDFVPNGPIMRMTRLDYLKILQAHPCWAVEFDRLLEKFQASSKP